MAAPTFISASTASEADALSVSVNRPSGLTTRTLLIMYASAHAAPSILDTPTGWTLKDSGDTTTGLSNPFYGIECWKVIEEANLASEPTSYTVSIQGTTNRSIQVGIVAYEDFGATPLGAHAKDMDGDTLAADIPMPDITTTGENSLVCRAAFGGSQATLGSGNRIDAQSGPLQARKRFEVAAASSMRPLAVFDEVQATAGAVGEELATQAEALVHVGMSTEIFQETFTETLNPDAIVGTPTNLTGALTDTWLV